MPNPAGLGLPNGHDYDAGPEIVVDNVTGLVWQRYVESTGRSLAQAVSYCESLVLGGYDDWRLPTLIELVSIVDFSKANPAIDRQAFDGTPVAAFWSSSPLVGDTSYGWRVNFVAGTTDIIGVGTSQVARCVR
jgi:hypothetical protein